MKKQWIFGAILVLIVAVLVVVQITRESKETDEEVVKIGVILPLTGELASYSDPMRKGMEFAAEEINRESPGKLILKFSDSRGEAKQAVTELLKFISVDKIDFFIGDISSTTTLAMISTIENNEKFLLSPGASSPKLTGISPLFARNYPSSLDESLKAAEYAFNILMTKKASIVFVNSEFGIGLKDAFESRFKELGGVIASTEPYDFGSSDFKTIITKLKSTNPELIYLAGNQKEMGHFMKQSRDFNLSTKVISNISFLEPDCLQIAQSSAEGVLVPVAYYNPKDSTMKVAFEFGRSFKERFKEYPTVASAVGYDAVKLIYTSSNLLGRDPKRVAEHIRNLSFYDGALGNISFQNGDVNMKTVFKVVRNGEPVDAID